MLSDIIIYFGSFHSPFADHLAKLLGCLRDKRQLLLAIKRRNPRRIESPGLFVPPKGLH